MTRCILCAAATVVAGCASYPAPVHRMADAEATTRSAEAVGAATEPTAILHVRLAQEEIAKARAAMNDGDNKRADFLLVRAKADADLALALTKEARAQAAAQRAQQEVVTLKANATSTTSTTGAQAPAKQGEHR